jgi:hypothetical protein
MSFVSTGGPRLLTWSCDPSTCDDYFFLVYSAIVQVVISGVCDNGSQPQAISAVLAYNCSEPVTLDAQGYPDYYPYGYDMVTATGSVYDADGVQFWFMFNDAGCDANDNYYYADPPTGC